MTATLSIRSTATATDRAGSIAVYSHALQNLRWSAIITFFRRPPLSPSLIPSPTSLSPLPPLHTVHEFALSTFPPRHRSFLIVHLRLMAEHVMKISRARPPPSHVSYSSFPDFKSPLDPMSMSVVD